VENPTAAPGTLCIYIFAAGNINPNSIDTFAGLQFGTPLVATGPASPSDTR
jgi:hypothetical protein